MKSDTYSIFSFVNQNNSLGLIEVGFQLFFSFSPQNSLGLFLHGEDKYITFASQQTQTTLKGINLADEVKTHTFPLLDVKSSEENAIRIPV